MTKTLRCAIYTRKSSEEGLEQDFNSLHAQREACEAFVRSQRHEGWELIRTSYDDGGISGGTMQRPALQRLLEDLQKGLVDIIVVYKVDRLTRSLADFARMVELFDKHGSSFVSVTQQFNTTSSMGRLTLNVLLSFAQFEREVTGERIRDKIKASKAKGIFMGGRVPLGYRVEDRKLIVREDEAKTVRLIFERYLALGSLIALENEAKALPIRGRAQTKPNDKTSQVGDGDGVSCSQGAEEASFPSSQTSHEGGILTYGALSQILRNPVYIGQVRHKDKVYEGQHEPLLERNLWDAVQAALNANRNGATGNRSKDNHSGYPLAGKIVDETGDHLTPSHTKKRGQKYRYYISWRLKTQKDPTGWRLPADALEAAVADAAEQVLGDQAEIAAALQAADLPPAAWPGYLSKIQTRKSDKSRHQTLTEIVSAVTVQEGLLQVAMDLSQLLPDSDGHPTPPLRLTKTVPLDLHRRGVEMRLVLRTKPTSTAKVDSRLVQAVARGHAWFEDLLAGKVASIQELSIREGVSKSYAGDIIKLAFLAPDIVVAIVAGRQPANLTSDRLTKATDLPIDWDQQKAYLGFA